VLVIYACLHPMSGWQSSGLPVFDYLAAPWPKYFSAEDMVFNILGYLPLGLTLVASLPMAWTGRRKVLITILLASLLSFGLETIQVFLPGRIASNLDIAANFTGALAGALIGERWGKSLFSSPHGLARWRERVIIAGPCGDVGLILFGLWLLAQLTPESLLFAIGDLRRLFGSAQPLPFQAGRLIAFEAAQTTSIMLAVGLAASCLSRTRLGPILVLALLAAGIGARVLATTFFFIPANPLAWLSPGARYGLAIGGLALAITLCLPRIIQRALAGTSLLAATVLINLMPISPYLLDSGHTIVTRGNFLHFHGLSTLVASLWPMAALGWLSVLGLWQGEKRHEQPDASNHSSSRENT
jgi:VanZ family protein